MGMTIGVCDSAPDRCAPLLALLREYGRSRGLVLEPEVFGSGEALLARVDAAGRFDLYILEMMLPDQSGLDLGMALRDRDREGLLIYLTDSREYAVESYLVRAFDYLLKPVETARLYWMLDQAVARLRDTWQMSGETAQASFTVKTRGGLRRLALDSVLYAELVGRTVCYHLTAGETVSTMTLRIPFRQAVAPILGDPRFMLCGSSFAVNLAQVAMVARTGLTFSGGQWLPLPRSIYAAVRQQWMTLLSAGGDETHDPSGDHHA